MIRYVLKCIYRIFMAGSLRWFTYLSDDGTDWAIFLDESNTEAANPLAGQNGAPVGQNYKPPSNLKPRYAVFGNQAATRQIKVTILNQTIYNALDNADTIPDPINPADTLAFIRKRPEVITPVPSVFDTGLNDGDN